MKLLKKAESILSDAPASLIDAVNQFKAADQGKKQLIKDFRQSKKAYNDAVKDHKKAFYSADRARALGIENARIAEKNLRAELDRYEIEKAAKNGI